MTNRSKLINGDAIPIKDKEYKGIYGSYSITKLDRLEVKLYRFSLLLCGASFSIGLLQWFLLGTNYAWIWLLLMIAGLGLALNWIHIYIRSIHKFLQLSWAAGCIGIGILIFQIGIENLLSNFASQPTSIVFAGPIFASLTGVGFKEFFCFRRPEAIGLTLILPISLVGYLSHVINQTYLMSLLLISSVLLLVLALRKFGTDPSLDIGDKSIFEFLASGQDIKTM